jgi:uracil-DNA glycosylase
MREAIKQMLKDQLWDELHPELDTISFDLAITRIEENVKSGKEVYPPPAAMFSAYQYVDPKDIKVVIIGQDPYHNGQANGMAFAVNKKPIPPSLRNIYKELCDEFDHRPNMDEFDFSLEHWAKQGVLLLNTSFTVVEKQPASHRGLWDFILHPTFRLIKWNSPKAIHVLWGKHAQGYTKYIDGAVIQAAHPAAEAYGNAGFFGCGHFYQINERLKARGEEPIDWFKLPESVSEEEQLKEYTPD